MSFCRKLSLLLNLKKTTECHHIVNQNINLRKNANKSDKKQQVIWFGMKVPELTDELKNDLKALKMRASVDPKRFYKRNDRDGFPKYFQIGTIVDNPADFYHS